MNETKDKFTVKGIDPEVLKRAKLMAVELDKPLSEILRQKLDEIVRDYEREKKPKK